MVERERAKKWPYFGAYVVHKCDADVGGEKKNIARK